MITPEEGKKFERNPEEGNFPTGVYVCELSRVEETGPGAKFPNGNNRLVFEFTVLDPNFPQFGGKKAVAFLGKTLHKSKDGRESNLVKWARMMGVVTPERGFDPEMLLGKKYQVTCELTPGRDGQPARAWARTAIALAPIGVASAASVAPPAAAPVANGVATPTSSFAGLDPHARWDATDGHDVMANKTTLEIQNFLTDNHVDSRVIKVKPAGAAPTLSRTAHEWGFISGKPGTTLEQIPW